MVTAKDYTNDTITYQYLFTDTLRILLQPAGNILPNVVVTGHYTRYQLDSIKRKADFATLLGSRIPTLSSSHPSGFGLTFNLDAVFKKKYRDLHKKEQIFANTERAAYVSYRFSPHLVAHFTGLKGSRLQDFIQRYEPSYEWLRKNTSNEDVLYYINDKLKSYRKIKR